MNIPYNKPYYTGKELSTIEACLATGKTSGDGTYSKLCQDFFVKKYEFKKALFTTSCTDALELSSLLIDIVPGDEIIVPSYTFVSTVNPFILRGATIKFADSCDDKPHISAKSIEKLISKKTKAVVIMHYAGIACDLEEIIKLCQSFNCILIEDTAQCINSYYKGKPLGSFGALSTFSFHDTKNIICGEGGMLVINDSIYNLNAEILREKGTNRAAFFRGETDKYGWIKAGSSFLGADLNAAMLYAQLQEVDSIHEKRLAIWNNYASELYFLENKGVLLPKINSDIRHNAHIFSFTLPSLEIRQSLISFLKSKGIQAPFHYGSLHQSPFFKERYQGEALLNADKFADGLLRLPLFVDLSQSEQTYIIDQIKTFFEKH